MIIQEILNLIDGQLITGKTDVSKEFSHGFASDLMSDVLTCDIDSALLITGLANLQTIRTAEMSDIGCIILARNKKASDEMIQLATYNHICLIETSWSLFKVVGTLYGQGLKPVY